VTNALNIAADLALASDNITTVVTGGVVRAPELSILGHITELTMEEMRVSRIFMGMQAVSIEGGLTTDHLPEVATTRKIIDMAADLTILADHTKLNHMAAAYIYPIIRMTHLITDSGADADFLARLEELGIQVIIAED
jgi:DeoR family fructose operon transcriptional repressor